MANVFGAGSALSALLGGLTGGGMAQSQAAQGMSYNAMYDQWVQMTQTSVLTTAPGAGVEMRKRGGDTFNPVTSRYEYRDEFNWLRNRVDEMCWKPS